MALSDYRVSDTDITQNAVVNKAGDRLTGTVQENKKIFDNFPNVIATKHNQLIDEYLSQNLPAGDCGLGYDNIEISYITSVLGCTEGDITL